MLLTRHFMKVANPTKNWVYRNLSVKPKLFVFPCTCGNFKILRSLTSSHDYDTKIKVTNLSKNRIQCLTTPSDTLNNTSAKNVTSEDLLEKLTAGLSSDIHQKNRVYKNDLVRVINKVKEINFSNKKQSLLLIRCCSELLVDESDSTRMVLVEQIWNIIKPHTKFEVEHYNELLRVYIANNRTLTVSSFIGQMAPVKPNATTYELILRALGEAGDVNQATEVISNMKAQNLPATESIFNSLILCQGKAGNLNNIQEVLTMMKSLKLEYSVDTYTALARAMIWNKQYKLMFAEMDKATSKGLQFEEAQIMEIVKTLASDGSYENIPKVLRYLPEETLKKPSISPFMQSVATSLVFRNQPIAALEIYRCLPLPSFGPKDDRGLHGRSLVRDCVKASIPSAVIGLITQDLMSSGRNPIALQNASEAALQLGKVPLALDLFMRMKQLGMPIRPHYFWPILLQNSKSYGEKAYAPVSSACAQELEKFWEYVTNTLDLAEGNERVIMCGDLNEWVRTKRDSYEAVLGQYGDKRVNEAGIMNILSTMVNMDVKPDYETIMEYTLPYVSFTSPQNLMKKFQEAGLSISTVLTPMMETLLNTGQVRAASEICELFQGKVEAERLLKPLLKGYLLSFDAKSTVHILEDIGKKAADKSKDWVGRFLCVFMHDKRINEDLSDVMNLIKAIKKTDLKISTAAVDHCLSRIPDRHSETVTKEFRTDLLEITDESIVDDADVFIQQMPHPKQMNEEALRAHLNELDAKNMNTRGVLRKLLQLYCREGNLDAARNIADRCQQEGVFLSAGMKAAIFDLHVKLGELELAEATLTDLSKTSPNFTLDEYKVIDFATLMVYKKRINQAFDLISDQSKRRRIVGGRGISMNCWRLLDATAATFTPVEAKRMFELLTTLRYCKPSNVILGPLIRAHLKNDNIQEAVNEFVRIANKYNKTPLKHELLCAILKRMADGKSEDNFIVNEKSNGKLNKLAQTVLNINKTVHGNGDVQLTLIAALADVGYLKTLRKMFLDPTVKFHPDGLLRRCERFAEEKKVHALDNIAQCAKGLRHVDVDEIYEMMLEVYQRDDNVTEALALWTRMQESDVPPSQKFVQNICSLAKANNVAIPSELSLLLNKQTKKVSST